MTDKEIADKIYIEPLTLEFVEKVIEKKDQIVYLQEWEDKQD